MFIVGLVLQPRISGQAILLPVFAAAMVWALWGLELVAVSPEGRRRLARTAGTAVIVTLLGLAGWFRVEPGGLSLVVLVAFIAGMVQYAAFARGWSERAGWTTAAEHYRRSRVNLWGIGVTTVVALAAVVVFAERPGPGPEPDWWNLVVGRTVGNGWVIAFFLLIAIGWIGACVELEKGAKALRAALAAEPDAPAPTA